MAQTRYTRSHSNGNVLCVHLDITQRKMTRHTRHYITADIFYASNTFLQGMKMTQIFEIVADRFTCFEHLKIPCFYDICNPSPSKKKLNLDVKIGFKMNDHTLLCTYMHTDFTSVIT